MTTALTPAQQVKQVREIVKAVKTALRMHGHFFKVLTENQQRAVRGLVEHEVGSNDFGSLAMGEEALWAIRHPRAAKREAAT